MVAKVKSPAALMRIKNLELRAKVVVKKSDEYGESNEAKAYKPRNAGPVQQPAAAPGPWPAATQDPSPAYQETARQAANVFRLWGPEIFDAALAVGGTLSGEHGVGVLKRPYFEQALGPVSVEVQRCIKQALDPLNILNPGKMFNE